jgi:hypothetical protein
MSSENVDNQNHVAEFNISNRFLTSSQNATRLSFESADIEMQFGKAIDRSMNQWW